MEMKSLDVVGYQNQPVPNTFITQSKSTGHLGIIMPGYRHSVDRVDLHYAGQILFGLGADLLRVEYAYYKTDFMLRHQAEQTEWLVGDVFPVCNAALDFCPYEHITLIGKSMGTLAMGHLIGDARFRAANCVWSTPLLTVEWLCSTIEAIRPRSLFIMGTADHFYNPDVMEHLASVTNGQTVIIEGAHHGLEIEGDVSGSLAGLHKIIDALEEFLARV